MVSFHGGKYEHDYVPLQCTSTTLLYTFEVETYLLVIISLKREIK